MSGTDLNTHLDAGHDVLRMVIVFRRDLALPPLKLAAQAGHAVLTTWLIAQAVDPDAALGYSQASQTKIALYAPDLPALLRIAEKAIHRRVPHALISDAARTVLPHPAVTCLGLGPMSKTNSNALTRGLELA